MLTPRSPKARLGLVGLVVAMVAAVAAGGPAHRPVRVDVPCGADRGLALVRAIDAVNSAGSGTVRLARRCTYTLTAPQDAGRAGLPEVTGTASVIGQSSVIRRAATAPPFRIVKVARGGHLTLAGTSVSGGTASGPGREALGGGIDNEGRLDLVSVALTGNAADRGAGLYNGPRAQAALTRTTVSGNRAAVAGGGVANLGTVTLERSRLSRNTARIGAAAFTADHTAAVTGTGRMTLFDSQVTDNDARVLGAGLYSTGSRSRLTVLGGAVHRNTSEGGAGGIFVSAGSALVSHAEVTGNTARATGGGVSANFAAVTLRDTTVTSNRADKGGGLYRPSGATVTSVRSRTKANTPDDCAAPGSVTGCGTSGAAPPAVAVSPPVRDGVVCASRLPDQARATLLLVAHGGPFPYPKDGTVFGNYEEFLPQARYGSYREYTVTTPGAADRGARRIVTGPGGAEYYSQDHYASFHRIAPLC
ncbi:hypothetical protein E3E14_21465 [Streptomyces sp. ICN441]|nr:hypothetical protein E3E14_21465 [Streptomyces sp. ICN441]